MSLLINYNIMKLKTLTMELCDAIHARYGKDANEIGCRKHCPFGQDELNSCTSVNFFEKEGAE